MNKYINKKLEYHCLGTVRNKSWNYFLLLKDTCKLKNVINAIENRSFFFPYTSFFLFSLFVAIYICILPIEDLRMLRDDAIIKILKFVKCYLYIHPYMH